jgi:hypothetical protein
MSDYSLSDHPHSSIDERKQDNKACVTHFNAAESSEGVSSCIVVVQQGTLLQYRKCPRSLLFSAIHSVSAFISFSSLLALDQEISSRQQLMFQQTKETTYSVFFAH